MKRHLPQLLLTLLLGAAACHHNVAREGDLDELRNATNKAQELPLQAAALQVERVEQELPPQSDQYRLGINDVLRVTVLGHKEYSSPEQFQYFEGALGTTISKDGCIYLPALSAFKAAGYTLEEFRSVLGQELARLVRQPRFTVEILRYGSQKAYVLGAVNAPGVITLDGSITLLEAIGKARGVRDDAALERGFVVRDRTLLPVNLASLLLRGDTSRNIYLQHGDLVYLPLGAELRVYVLGEVRQPRAVPITHGRLTIIQAIAEAGGLLPIESDEASIKLIRGNWESPVVYTLSYATVLEEGHRISLQPGDRIIVQPTALTTFTRYMQQLLPFLVGADTGTQIYERVLGSP